MTIASINTLISEYAGVDTNAFTNATRVIHINEWMHKIITMILQSQDDWEWDDTSIGNYPIVTRALVAGRRDYLFSTAAWSTIGVEGGAVGANAAISPLRIKRVDICWDGSGNTCYRTIPLDSREINNGLGNATDESALFTQSNPYYELRGGAIWIYPTATAGNVTNSGILRIEFDRKATDFTTSDITTGTKVPPFDEAFHPMIAIGVARDWGVAHGRENIGSLSQLLQEYEIRLKQYVGTKELDSNIVLKAGLINYN